MNTTVALTKRDAKLMKNKLAALVDERYGEFGATISNYYVLMEATLEDHLEQGRLSLVAATLDGLVASAPALFGGSSSTAAAFLQALEEASVTAHGLLAKGGAQRKNTPPPIALSEAEWHSFEVGAQACLRCNGEGVLFSMVDSARGSRFSIHTTCPDCNGTGHDPQA